MTEQEILSKLSAPFEVERAGKKYPAHKWLPQNQVGDKIMCVAYLDKTMCVERLTEVFGLNWMDEYETHQDGSVTCKLSYLHNDTWMHKSGKGALTSSERDRKNTKNIDKNIKGAESDAFKRACQKLGIGLYLNNMAHRLVKTKTTNRGKVTPVDHDGKFLYGQKLSDYLNGIPLYTSFIVDMVTACPETWQFEETQALWNKFKTLGQ